MADVLPLHQEPPEHESPRRRSRIREDDALQLLSPDQVAALLSCSRATVDRLVRSGRLAHVTLASGKRKKLYGIRRKTLQRFIEQNEKVGE